MRDFLTFDRMITPVLIQVVFIIGSGLMVIGGLFAAGAARDSSGVWAGLAVAILGPFLLRIYSEIVIVVFKIHEATEASRDALEDMAGRLAPAVTEPPPSPTL